VGYGFKTFYLPAGLVGIYMLYILALSCLSKSGALILPVKANVDFMIVPAPLLVLDFSNEYDLKYSIHVM